MLQSKLTTQAFSLPQHGRHYYLIFKSEKGLEFLIKCWINYKVNINPNWQSFWRKRREKEGFGHLERNIISEGDRGYGRVPNLDSPVPVMNWRNSYAPKEHWSDAHMQDSDACTWDNDSWHPLHSQHLLCGWDTVLPKPCSEFWPLLMSGSEASGQNAERSKPQFYCRASNPVM